MDHQQHLFGLQRFKQSESVAKKKISPSEVNSNGNPINREYHSKEMFVPFAKLSADSTYIHTKDNVVEKFEPKNVIMAELFWCSAGDHGLREEVKFYIEFERNHLRNHRHLFQKYYWMSKFAIDDILDHLYGAIF